MRAGHVVSVVWAVAAVVHIEATVWAQQPADGPNDWELASVVAGMDRAVEVEQKLGHSPCLLPSSTGETISFLYNMNGKDGPLFLRLIITDHVRSMTISKDPPIAGVCYGPVQQAVVAQTGRGLRIGAAIDEIVRMYGNPTESFSVGPMTRFRYIAASSGRRGEWDLVFRNKLLVEWTVAVEE